jgi:hypothetical protein
MLAVADMPAKLQGLPNVRYRGIQRQRRQPIAREVRLGSVVCPQLRQ